MPADVDRIKELAPVCRSTISAPDTSLAYLQRFPLTRSRSISPSCARRHAARGRSSCGQLSRLHDLGMEVVAEGAETDSDAVELYQLGCEYAQGFAFGEPMTSDAARDLLVDKPSRLRALKIASE
jgi:EAL domain-containing protein (putative c-di-GMP-specific phosphodiesterase class I)